ncbi:hypothetical protein RclHR1_00740027 [Rhizophagus clarus]|nr:hypothetical protein RclHR1_00740027 [Rhizophagus clarus]
MIVILLIVLLRDLVLKAFSGSYSIETKMMFDIKNKIIKEKRDSFPPEIISAVSIRVWAVRGVPKDDPRLDDNAFVESLTGGE